MAKFTIGDVVMLKSDSDESTPMTVENYYLDTFDGQQASRLMGVQKDWDKQVRCIWRDSKSSLHQEIFHEDTLRLVRNV